MLKGGDEMRLQWKSAVAMGTVVIYPREEDWIWKPSISPPARYEYSRLGLPNNAAFKFELRLAEGTVLDQFVGERQLIREGVSINRFPDGKGRGLVLHSAIHGVSSSPGLSASGRPFRTPIRESESSD